MKVASVRMPADLDARLDRLSTLTGRPRGFYVRQALQMTLPEFERVYLTNQEQPDPARIAVPLQVDVP